MSRFERVCLGLSLSALIRQTVENGPRGTSNHVRRKEPRLRVNTHRKEHEAPSGCEVRRGSLRSVEGSLWSSTPPERTRRSWDTPPIQVINLAVVRSSHERGTDPSPRPPGASWREGSLSLLIDTEAPLLRNTEVPRSWCFSGWSSHTQLGQLRELLRVNSDP